MNGPTTLSVAVNTEYIPKLSEASTFVILIIDPGIILDNQDCALFVAALVKVYPRRDVLEI